MAKYKYYVVWEGRARGIFDSWEACKEQVDNFKGAKYKSFDSLEAATEAFRNIPDDFSGVLRKIGERSRDKLEDSVPRSLPTAWPSMPPAAEIPATWSIAVSTRNRASSSSTWAP